MLLVTYAGTMLGKVWFGPWLAPRSDFWHEAALRSLLCRVADRYINDKKTNFVFGSFACRKYCGSELCWEFWTIRLIPNEETLYALCQRRPSVEIWPFRRPAFRQLKSATVKAPPTVSLRHGF